MEKHTVTGTVTFFSDVNPRRCTIEKEQLWCLLYFHGVWIRNITKRISRYYYL